MAELYNFLSKRRFWVDFTDVHIPSWKIREVQKAAAAKRRALKRIDPYARVGGAHRVYETPEQLKKACDEYFKSRETFLYNKHGEPLRDPVTGEYEKAYRPLSLAGLALHLGIQTKTLMNYHYACEAGLIPPEFGIVVMEARQKIEAYAEERGYDREGAAGSKFVLQSGFDWKTEKERREEIKLRVDAEVAEAKLKMEKEMHRLKMRMLEAGLNPDEDSNNVQITITRATKEGQ